MQLILQTLEFLPVILAIIATILIAQSYQTVRRKTDLIVKMLMLASCLILIVAQTTWWQAAVIDDDLTGTWFGNFLWLIFNILVMVAFIVASTPRKGK